MNRWIVPCNIKKYDVVGAFQKYSEIDWVQRLKDVEPGDRVYIYIGVPVSQIRYSCEVILSNITSSTTKLIDDNEFIIDEELENRESKVYMRLRLLHEFEDNELSLVALRSYGIVGNIQSARSVPESLETYIKSLETTYGSATSVDTEGYTITQADIDRIKEHDAKMTPEERLEVSKGLVESASMPSSWNIGTFSSWTIRNETIAVKQCDKSFFEYRGSTIPREVYWYFDVESLAAGEKKNITLNYEGADYKAYLQREIHELARIRIFWEQSLADAFDEYNVPSKYPKLVFSKASDSVYEVSFEEKPLSNKAIEVAQALLKLIVNRTRLITYGELSEMTESKPSPYYEMRMLLDAINKRCDKLGLPYISAMVVNKSTGMPGEGFRDLCIDYFGYDPEMTTEEIFEAELDRIGKCDEWFKLADYLGVEMPTEDEEHLPEEVEDVPGEPIIEGAKKTITVNSYERDPKAKKICKDFYMKRDGRITCQVCGFDFGEVYGPEYANKIHVHHIVPVSEIGEEYIVDPVKDLIPVCPNCHMILHAGKGISVEDLKKRIKKNTK